ncbi:retron Ec67 family RNA-directed DNA polymerase/endonuclease [Dickeya chrysanthemi]|uniref:retron Ec67 family RNA-directed DNA polymerase/endonuclease n=1 Tax=Dickeya chrysanthemi TaxID=556 RepID=UPI001C8F008C|nr:retron Ec67 family RNA-directed DNA polymerase/endonuclease [Dickeya chrysanthemi]MBX9447355.1 retron Ec67 family RNA-directed DNA polymerase/endonuclease [Dickeya chrysanthemi]
MSFLAKLKESQNISDIANLLGCSPKSLAYTIYKSQNNYITFKISKKNGGHRDIKAPAKKLKELQRRLAKGLQECIEEIHGKKNKKISSHGYTKGKSIFTNAYEHKNKNLVLNLDLEDFFDSINFGRVRGYFIHNKNFMLPEKTATIIAQIACHENSLPQGSPCSPVISNMVAQILDVKLSALAKKNKCFYTRYVDDLTISTNRNVFPIDIMELHGHNPIIGKSLINEIKRSGFTINDNKTRVQRKNSRQDVTGLIVNKKVNVKSEFKHLARAMANNFFKNNQAFMSLSGEKTPISLEKLNGMLSFIYQIRNRMDVQNANDQPRKAHDSFEKTYSDFLFYKNFAANSRTVVICEGETDNIYLNYAFKNLVSYYPELQNYGKGIKKRIDIHLFKQTKLLSRLLNITDGTGNNIKLLNTYQKRMSRFSSPPRKFPVILLLDNDSGSVSVEGVINREFMETREILDGFIYVCENFYVVKTPLIFDMKETKIEDFFDTKTLSKKLGEKSFTTNNKFDKNLYFGKKKFAEIIVKQNHRDINFSKFKMIIDLFQNIIIDYRRRMDI